MNDLISKVTNDSNTPAEVRAFGRVLGVIIAGERNPDISGLSPELANAVRSLLESLE